MEIFSCVTRELYEGKIYRIFSIVQTDIPLILTSHWLILHYSVQMKSRTVIATL